MIGSYNGVYSKAMENNPRKSFSVRTLNRAAIICLVVFGLYYVAGVNDLVAKGFKLQELKNKMVALADENRDLSAKVTTLKSYNNLAKRIEKLDMVATGKVDYIKVNSSVLAAR